MLTTALHRFLTIAIAIAAGVAALAFSVAVFTFIAATGVLAFAYAWARQKFGRPQRVEVPRRGRGEIIDVPSREIDRD